ncbi:hypothetical protein AAFF_G00170550 [Aldrovandia affinis]|uniref:Uncharacterized protein n=1 Tax=Aldrovandia affinis TaxID=143900 RepID=A0AAD7VX52_9TELE|nr:hypothetical protein AAFF_G00170550 [Aldrovandia affinis]
MSVQDLSHRQTPQSTPPVEVTHRCRRAPSTHPAPPDSSRHPRGNHHLATGQPRVQGPVVQSLRTRDRGGTDGRTSPPPRKFLLAKLAYKHAQLQWHPRDTLPPATEAHISPRLTHCTCRPTRNGRPLSPGRAWHEPNREDIRQVKEQRKEHRPNHHHLSRQRQLPGVTTHPVCCARGPDGPPSSEPAAARPEPDAQDFHSSSHTANPPESPMSSAQLPQNRTEDLAMFTLEPVPA